MLTSGRPRKNRRKGEVDYRKPLIERELRFVDAFVVNPIATEAAEKVGYHRLYGKKLLNKPNVAAAIRRRMQDATEKADIAAADVVLELGRIGFANIADFLEEDAATGLPKFRRLSDISRKNLAAVAEMTIEETTEGKGEDAIAVRRVRFKLHNKLDALSHLGKYLKIFAEDKEPISVQNNVTVVVQNAVSAVDGILERVISGGALGSAPAALPNGPVVSAEVHPPQA